MIPSYRTLMIFLIHIPPAPHVVSIMEELSGTSHDLHVNHTSPTLPCGLNHRVSCGQVEMSGTSSSTGNIVQEIIGMGDQFVA
jgi:hypothetical protein